MCLRKVTFAGDEHAVFHLRAAPRCLQPTLPVDSGADRGSGGDSQPVQKVSLEGSGLTVGGVGLTSCRWEKGSVNDFSHSWPPFGNARDQLKSILSRIIFFLTWPSSTSLFSFFLEITSDL